METVRERILQNIKTTLEAVTIANGYNFDFTPQTVQRWSMHGNRMVDMPMAVISPGDEDESSSPHPFEECVLTVYLDVFFINDENDAVPTDTYLNRLQGDIKKRSCWIRLVAGTLLILMFWERLRLRRLRRNLTPGSLWS